MKLLTSIALAAGVMFGSSTANAMPVAPTSPVSGLTTEVGWRCGGPGWHMNRWGNCVPNRGYYRRGYYGPPHVYGYYGGGPRLHHRRWRHRHWR